MKKLIAGLLFLWFYVFMGYCCQAQTSTTVSQKVMQATYEKIKTPYKYGLVLVPENNGKKLDCPTVFRKNNQWYMSYIVFDGQGYETWLAKSADLLHWTTQGKILSFGDTSAWDNNQKAGYIALVNPAWGGNYQPQQFEGKYWLSYIGGSSRGYEAGVLSIGLANTSGDITQPHEWQTLPQPVLTPKDADTRWWENNTLFKSTTIWDSAKITGYPFVMYYNARGDSINPANANTERIGMAVSTDMTHWKRFGKNPVLDHQVGITGDAVFQKIDNLWVLFYFGAFWKNHPGAFNRFACSYDLVHWTDWMGDDLVKSSEPYDETYAHKSCVVKYNGVVYHFYCAVNKADQRGIAVATSRNLGTGKLEFSKQIVLEK